MKTKKALITAIRKIKPPWETDSKYCGTNCAQCDGFNKAKEEVIKLIEQKFEI